MTPTESQTHHHSVSIQTCLTMAICHCHRTARHAAEPKRPSSEVLETPETSPTCCQPKLPRHLTPHDSARFSATPGLSSSCLVSLLPSLTAIIQFCLDCMQSLTQPLYHRTVPTTSQIDQHTYPTEFQTSHHNVSIHNRHSPFTTDALCTKSPHHNHPTTGLRPITVNTLKQPL